MKSILFLMFFGLATLLGACSAAPTSTSLPTASPTPTPDIEATVAAFVATEVAGMMTATPTLPRADQSTSLVAAWVVNVVDGDTIDVLTGTTTYRVRYIGVDTPETVHPTIGEEPYGREASERNRQLVLGKTVYLERDVSETDQFGRLLRYVWLEDGRMVNAVLVAEGYAQVATYPPDVRYSEEFLDLQGRAQRAGKGLWAASGTESTVVGGCDPAYPDVCIPPPPPDLDCGEITHRRFTVLPPAPHRFDGDRDGIGCER